MTLYKDLNDIPIDEDFDERALTPNEQKRIARQVKTQINRRKTRKIPRGIIAAAMTLVVLTPLVIIPSLTAYFSSPTAPVEMYINQIKSLDYEEYKTKIGETIEHPLGSLTLDEVLIDDRKIYFGATYRPADGVDVNYKTQFFPTIKIDGVESINGVGAQTIEKDNNTFAIYNHIETKEPIEEANIQIEIAYDRFEKQVIDNPWSFQIEVSQQELLAERKVQEINQTVKTESGPITIQEAVITPISTTIFFDLSQASDEDIPLVLTTQNKEYALTNESYMNIEKGSNSYFRFYDLDYQANDYYLIVEDDETGWKLPIGAD